MLSRADNEMLTQTDKGTPMGELFRRFWLPAMLAEELPGPDCAPVRVTLLGEQMVAFRDSDGRVGILDAYCPHRGAPLFFGRNEERGLRCIYHGWKFDADGNCVDMPSCIEGESFKNRVKVTAYPTWEAGGMVWVYMGPADKMPPKPAYELLDAPETHRYVSKFFLNCNYFQALENEFKEGHLPFLHRDLVLGENGGPLAAITGSPDLERSILKRAEQPQDPAKLTIVDTDFGQVAVDHGDLTPDGRQPYHLSNAFWMPCFSPAGGLNAQGVYNVNIRVPVDDEHIVFFRCKWSEEPLTEKMLWEMKHGGVEFPELIPGTYLPKQNMSNDYEIDRVRQRFYNFSGLVNVPVQDVAMLENQRGPIADRTREQLVSSDKWIIQARRRMLDAAKALQNGVEPREPWHPESYRFRRSTVLVDPGTPVEEAIKPALEPWPRPGARRDEPSEAANGNAGNGWQPPVPAAAEGAQA